MKSKFCQHEFYDLLITIESNSDCYPQILAIYRNLVNKMARGVYDSEKAPKAFSYLVHSEAKRYAKYFGMVPFGPAVRNAVASDMVVSFEDLVRCGDWYELLNKANVKRLSGCGKSLAELGGLV